MANPDRFFMSSPRFYVEGQRTRDDISDYRYHRDYNGRHSIADLSLTSYRDRDRERHRNFELSYRRTRSRDRSTSRSSSSSRDRSRHSRSRRSRSRRDRQSRRHHRSRSSSSDSSTDLSSLATLELASPPQFVTPIQAFEKSERGDLAIRIGDTIEVRRYVDKNWYKGYNLTTRRKGIFPIAYVKEIEISSTKAIEPLSGGRRAVSQPRFVKDKLLVEMPKETEKKGSFFYPTDTVLVRNRGNKTTSTGFDEINQDVILIKQRDTVNHEPRQIVEPTVERDIVEVDHGRHRHVIEQDITIIKPRRAVSPPPLEDERVVIPIRRKEISLSEIPYYANHGPDVDIERIKTRSRHKSPERQIIIEKEPRDVIVERPIIVQRPREIEEASSVSRHSRSRARSVKEIRLERDATESPPRRRKEYKALPPAKTITYNEYGAPVFVDTQTFAPAPVMSVPPRPYYAPRQLEPAPIPVLPQRQHRVYEY